MNSWRLSFSRPEMMRISVGRPLGAESKDSPSPRWAPLFAPTHSRSCQMCAGLSAEPERTHSRSHSTRSAQHKHTIECCFIVTWIRDWPESVTLMSCLATSRHQRTQRAPTPLWKTHMISRTFISLSQQLPNWK